MVRSLSPYRPTVNSRSRVHVIRDPDRLLGLELPRLARRLLPDGLPARRWLEAYAEHFDTVEVNTTFYRLPARGGGRRWVEETPDGFVFAVKASRYLTHIRRLRDVADGMARWASASSRSSRRTGSGDAVAAAAELPPRRRAPGGRAGRDAAGATRVRAPAPELVRRRRRGPAARARRRVRRRRRRADGPARGAGHRVLALPAVPLRAPRTARQLRPKRARRLGAGIRSLRAGDVFAYFNNDWEAFAPRNAEGVLSRLRG